jgi:hypothetical protein
MMRAAFRICIWCICSLLVPAASAQEGPTAAERAKERHLAGIHSTILIDNSGRVYWAQHGGAPFDDFKFLKLQLQRMNQKHSAASATTTAP